MIKYLFLLGGIAFVLIRGTLFLISKLSQGNLISQIKKNPKKATAYVEHLDIPYGKRDNVSTAAYKLLTAKMQNIKAAGKYKILYALEVNEREFLVFTELTFIDFDVTVTGHSSDVKKTTFHNFVIRHSPEAASIQVLSELYNSSTEKFQREEFLPALLSAETII
jgi:hypothetical protein